MTCLRYFISIRENCSLSLLMLCCGLLRLISCLIVGLCMEPLMLAVAMMGGRIFQPCCVRSGWSMSYLSSLWDVATSGNMFSQYVNSSI